MSGSQSRAHPPARERDRARHPALDEPSESEGQCLAIALTVSLAERLRAASERRRPCFIRRGEYVGSSALQRRIPGF